MSIHLGSTVPSIDIPLGIYIHFPYCSTRCPYCDFTLSTQKIDHKGYLRAVLLELQVRYQELVIPLGQKIRLHSLYFGGGTPALWDVKALEEVILWMQQHFIGVEDAEITIEANPAEMTLEQAQSWRKIGINRLSLGTQSFNAEYLKHLGRTHSPQQSRNAFTWARIAGFERINLDLIHGMHAQSVAEARIDLQHTLELEPEHIALYQLSIEARTSFGARAHRGEELLAPEQRLIDIYHALSEDLSKSGRELYEVSNAAKPQEYSRHNFLYWTLGQYWGIGVGAHGLVHTGMSGARWQNIKSIKKYLNYGLLDSVELAQKHRLVIIEDSQELTYSELLEESVLIGLRLVQGMPITPDLYQKYALAFNKQIQLGFIEEKDGYWRATLSGRMLLDHITWKVLLDDE